MQINRSNNAIIPFPK
jgi:tubulin--tyrosine ligase